jgi:hypothetical protein
LYVSLIHSHLSHLFRFLILRLFFNLPFLFPNLLLIHSLTRLTFFIYCLPLYPSLFFCSYSKALCFNFIYYRFFSFLLVTLLLFQCPDPHVVPSGFETHAQHLQVFPVTRTEPCCAIFERRVCTRWLIQVLVCLATGP